MSLNLFPVLGIADPVVTGGWGGPRYSLGLTELDERLGGGLAVGELWVLTGAPGHGRSMLLTQIAARLALHHRLPSWLVSSRDPSPVVAGRLMAREGRVSLSEVADDLLTGESRDRLLAARKRLEAAPLSVFAGADASQYWPSEHADEPTGSPRVVLLDDPRWTTTSEVGDLTQARALANRGWAVVVTLPRSLVLSGTSYQSDLREAMSAADVVIDVRSSELRAVDATVAFDEPGLGALTVLRNRRGPVGSVFVDVRHHHAWLVDRALKGKLTWGIASARPEEGG
jgi:predicted ATPase